MSKLLLLTLNEQEEKVIDKIISAIADYIQFEPTQIAPASVLSFLGLEIRQFQRRVMMIERLSFPGVFFCPCGRLEALFRAIMGIYLRHKMPRKCP